MKFKWWSFKVSLSYFSHTFNDVAKSWFTIKYKFPPLILGPDQRGPSEEFVPIRGNSTLLSPQMFDILSQLKQKPQTKSIQFRNTFATYLKCASKLPLLTRIKMGCRTFSFVTLNASIILLTSTTASLMKPLSQINASSIICITRSLIELISGANFA